MKVNQGIPDVAIAIPGFYEGLAGMQGSELAFFATEKRAGPVDATVAGKPARLMLRPAPKFDVLSGGMIFATITSIQGAA